MGILKILSFLIVIIFSFIGVFISGNVLHELSHWADFKNIEKENESICFLTLSEDHVGYYSFNPLEGQEEEIERLDRFTEIKAYSIDFFLMGVYFICLFGVIRAVIN